MKNITIWNEFRHEKINERVAAVYPKGIHGALAEFIAANPEYRVRTATLDEPESGLTQEVLDSTDVLIWWGHKAHDDLPDEIARRVHQRVLEGMGFIALHSSHLSKPFKLLMGTSCTLKWRKSGEKARLWNIAPNHPITQGIGDYFELEHTEMYGERFDIPEPDQTLFLSWFPGGEVFRSGCVWNRGNGRVFYFKPGHETFPIYYDKNIQQVIRNAIAWCMPTVNLKLTCPNVEPLEPIEQIEC